MTDTIDDGGLLKKDPAEVRVWPMDWGDELADSVEIAQSTWTVTGLHGDITTTPVTLDQASVLSGNRRTRVRVSAGALGSYWRIDNQVVTNESPAQTYNRGYFLSVEDL